MLLDINVVVWKRKAYIFLKTFLLNSVEKISAYDLAGLRVST